MNELGNLDLVSRDWMNFLSFGRVLTPVGNSDSHYLQKSPAGLPRTLVRVGDDSPDALRAGLEDDVYATLLGEGTARDVVVTDGPMISVTESGHDASVIGARSRQRRRGVPLDLRRERRVGGLRHHRGVRQRDLRRPRRTTGPPSTAACFTNRTAITATDLWRRSPAAPSAQRRGITLTNTGGAKRYEATVTFT